MPSAREWTPHLWTTPTPVSPSSIWTPIASTPPSCCSRKTRSGPAAPITTSFGRDDASPRTSLRRAGRRHAGLGLPHGVCQPDGEAPLRRRAQRHEEHTVYLRRQQKRQHHQPAHAAADLRQPADTHPGPLAPRTRHRPDLDHRALHHRLGTEAAAPPRLQPPLRPQPALPRLPPSRPRRRHKPPTRGTTWRPIRKATWRATKETSRGTIRETVKGTCKETTRRKKLRRQLPVR